MSLKSVNDISTITNYRKEYTFTTSIKLNINDITYIIDIVSLLSLRCFYTFIYYLIDVSHSTNEKISLDYISDISAIYPNWKIVKLFDLQNSFNLDNIYKNYKSKGNTLLNLSGNFCFSFYNILLGNYILMNISLKNILEINIPDELKNYILFEDLTRYIIVSYLSPEGKRMPINVSKYFKDEISYNNIDLFEENIKNVSFINNNQDYITYYKDNKLLLENDPFLTKKMTCKYDIKNNITSRICSFVLNVNPSEIFSNKYMENDREKRVKNCQDMAKAINFYFDKLDIEPEIVSEKFLKLESGFVRKSPNINSDTGLSIDISSLRSNGTDIFIKDRNLKNKKRKPSDSLELLADLALQK